MYLPNVGKYRLPLCCTVDVECQSVSRHWESHRNVGNRYANKFNLR